MDMLFGKAISPAREGGFLGDDTAEVTLEVYVRGELARFLNQNLEKGDELEISMAEATVVKRQGQRRRLYTRTADRKTADRKKEGSLIFFKPRM